MLRRLVLVVGIAATALGCTGARAAIVEGEPRVEIWTDRGTGGVYRVGDDVEICLRADRDCYVMVYEIDTDGYLRLLFPGTLRKVLHHRAKRGRVCSRLGLLQAVQDALLAGVRRVRELRL